jgi:hypothetical protein
MELIAPRSKPTIAKRPEETTIIRGTTTFIFGVFEKKTPRRYGVTRGCEING